MKPIRILAYSDIHYDKLGARCVTLQDCLDVEQRIIDRLATGNFDACVFCGDRFLKRNPDDEVKTKASLMIQEFKSVGVPYLYLVGNHDWVDKSMTWHTGVSLQDGNPSLWLLDGPKSLVLGDMTFFALSAGSRFESAKFSPARPYLNILLFHDLLSGCSLPSLPGVDRESGISFQDIQQGFDLVLGGDLHKPTVLIEDERGRRGLYLGSVIQRTMADADEAHGWWEIGLAFDQQWKVVSCEMVPCRGFFSHISVGALTVAEELQKSQVQDLYVGIDVCGMAKDVDSICDSGIIASMLKGSRGYTINKKYTDPMLKDDSLDAEISKSSSVVSDLDLYLNGGGVVVSQDKREKIFKALEYLTREA